MVIGESQYSLAKTKWYLVNLAALCDESTGSRDQGRTENVFCLYWGFLQDLPFIPRETGEMWIGEIDSMVQQKWTVLWSSEVCDQWDKACVASHCHKMHNPWGNETGFRKRKQFCRKDLVVKKASTQFGQWVGRNDYFPPDFWGCIWFWGFW